MPGLDELRHRFGLELEGKRICESCARQLSDALTMSGRWCASEDPVEVCWRSCREELARAERELLGKS